MTKEPTRLDHFVIERKNWLFSNTPKVAAVSATIYNIVQITDEDDIILFEYLKYLLEELPNLNIN